MKPYSNIMSSSLFFESLIGLCVSILYVNQCLETAPFQIFCFRQYSYIIYIILLSRKTWCNLKNQDNPHPPSAWYQGPLQWSRKNFPSGALRRENNRSSSFGIFETCQYLRIIAGKQNLLFIIATTAGHHSVSARSFQSESCGGGNDPHFTIGLPPHINIDFLFL